jgi:hypothetical protein
MQLHQLHLTLDDDDLGALLRAGAEHLEKVSELSAQIGVGGLTLRGRVKHVVTVNAELQRVPQVVGSILTLEIVRVDAVGPMGAMLLPMLLGQINQRYGDRGVSCAGRTITVDLERGLATYGWTVRLDAASLDLQGGAAELRLSGAFTPPA